MERERGQPAPFTIFGEPCFNPDWDPGQETVFEFANRMRVDHGWIEGLYELPHPPKGRYPDLRVDEDSIMYVGCIHLHIPRPGQKPDPSRIGVEMHYISSRANHLELIKVFQKTGMHATDGRRETAKILSAETQIRA